MEWVAACIPLAVGVVGLGVRLSINRRNKKEAQPYGIWVPQASKGVLTARQRSDIYQDMDWWDREFRKLSGEPEPEEIDGLAGSLASLANAIQLAMNPKPITDAELLTKYGNLSYTYNGNSQTTKAQND